MFSRGFFLWFIKNPDSMVEGESVPEAFIKYRTSILIQALNKNLYLLTLYIPAKSDENLPQYHVMWEPQKATKICHDTMSCRKTGSTKMADLNLVSEV